MEVIVCGDGLEHVEELLAGGLEHVEELLAGGGLEPQDVEELLAGDVEELLAGLEHVEELLAGGGLESQDVEELLAGDVEELLDVLGFAPEPEAASVLEIFIKRSPSICSGATEGNMHMIMMGALPRIWRPTPRNTPISLIPVI